MYFGRAPCFTVRGAVHELPDIIYNIPDGLGFQWDIFLLETGAASILYAPFFTLSARGR